MSRCSFSPSPLPSDCLCAAVAQPQPVEPSDDNPLAGRPWGVYKGKADQAWEPYLRAKGHKKKLLGKIALRPKAKWYGAWIPDRDIEAKIREHVANATKGDPETLFSAPCSGWSPGSTRPATGCPRRPR